MIKETVNKYTKAKELKEKTIHCSDFKKEYKVDIYPYSDYIIDIRKEKIKKSILGRKKVVLNKVAEFNCFDLIVRVYERSEYDKMKKIAEEFGYLEIQRNFIDCGFK